VPGKVPDAQSRPACATAPCGRPIARKLRSDGHPFDLSGVKGFESYAWYGFFAPGKTPKDVVAKLNAAALEVMKQPEWQKETGSEFVGDTPAQFTVFTRAEAAKWAKVVKDSGATVD